MRQDTVTPGDATLLAHQIHVLRIAEGFFQPSILFALLELRIFDLIGDGSRSVDELAAEVGARAETLGRLLNAGTTLKLLETQDGITFRLAPVSRSVLLPSAAENYLGNAIRLEYFNSMALSRLTDAVLKSGPTVDASSLLGPDGDRTREFIVAMHNYAALRGTELAHYLDTSASTTLLDLGCGPGTYAFQLGMRNPELHLFLADRTGVLEIAREIQARHALTNKVTYLPLDVLKDHVPGSYDIVLVSNVLHMLGERESRALIRRLYRSVNQGGSVVIQAQFLQDDRLGPQWPIYLDLVQLCITSEGRNHTVLETKEWLEAAGFRNAEWRRMGMFNLNSFLRAYKL